MPRSAVTVVERDFELLIGRDWKVVGIYSACTGLMVVFGVVCGVASVQSGSEQVELMVRWGGACTAALGGVLPVRQAWVRVYRIIDLKTLHAKWRELIATESPPKSDLDRIESILWRLYGEGLTGVPSG